VGGLRGKRESQSFEKEGVALDISLYLCRVAWEKKTTALSLQFEPPRMEAVGIKERGRELHKDRVFFKGRNGLFLHGPRRKEEGGEGGPNREDGGVPRKFLSAIRKKVSREQFS